MPDHEGHQLELVVEEYFPDEWQVHLEGMFVLFELLIDLLEVRSILPRCQMLHNFLIDIYIAEWGGPFRANCGCYEVQEDFMGGT